MSADTADLLAEAADLVTQVLDDCDARLEIRAGHGTGLVSDMQRWRHRAAAHCPANEAELAPCACPRRIIEMAGHRQSCIDAGRHVWPDTQGAQS